MWRFFRKQRNQFARTRKLVPLLNKISTHGTNNFVRYFTGGQTEFIECIGIFAAIFLAVGVTVIMEGRSEKAFEALNQINEDVQVKVKRGGSVTLISQSAQ